jgi:hypothetical protein
MKKAILGISCVALISLMSCKKDRVCECTTDSGVTDVTFTNISSGDAADACANREFYLGSFSSKEASCKIK